MLIRENHTDQAFNDRTIFDVIVIGGGITGIWTALDATTRGFKTLLLEQDDFASGASSKSSKLIHGGIRYLQQGKLGLVREALREQSILKRNAPHLVSPLPFIIGCYSKREKYMYGLGLHFYDFLAGGRDEEGTQILSIENTLTQNPTIISEKLEGAVQYYDASVEDARLAIDLLKTLDLYGGYSINYCKVTSLLKTHGKVSGVVAHDLESDSSHEIQGKVVINATGVFTDETLKLDDKLTPPVMMLSRGTHIVVDKSFLPSSSAFVIPKTPDKRVLFVIPWLGKTLIGTTDIPEENPNQHPRPTCEEIDFILGCCNDYLVHAPKERDILSCFTGIRPLTKGLSNATSQLSRRHKIIEGQSGLWTVTGGKYTIARFMAEDVLNRIIAKGTLPEVVCKTRKLKIHETPQLLEEPLLHSNLPYSLKDLNRGIKEEMAMHVSDLLSRRTRSFLLDTEASKEVIPKAAKLLAKHLDKDQAWIDQEIENANLDLNNYTCK